MVIVLIVLVIMMIWWFENALRNGPEIIPPHTMPAEKHAKTAPTCHTGWSESRIFSSTVLITKKELSPLSVISANIARIP